MHWTAFLAYRRFPAYARVADDLACVGCGYNLRSALANGNCPECSKAVGDSLFVLNQPEIVGRSLRTIGKTHLSFLALVLGCAPSLKGWPIIVAFGVMGLMSVVRVMALGELRHRGAIDTLPIVGTRLRFWWRIGVLESLLAWATCAMLWIDAKFMFTTPGFRAAITALVIVWLVVHLLETFLAGWFGTSLATMLWYTFARWEFVAQRIALAAMVLVIPLLALTSNRNVQLALIALCFLLLGMAMITTATGLTHLGNGAEGETDTWDDVVDMNPQGRYSQPRDASKPEPPPIKLE